MWRAVADLLRILDAKRLEREMWRIARGLTPLTLKADQDDLDEGFGGLCPDDLLSRKAPPRFLNYYSVAGIDRALRAYRFDERLRALGYRDFCTRLTRDDAFTTTLRVYGICDGDGCEDAVLVHEHRARLMQLPRPRWLPDKAWAELGADVPAVRLEWMLLQNPLATFTRERPRLPGQSHPGLGFGREVLEILRILGWRLRVAAWFINPFYVHNGALYAPHFQFCEPDDQGWFQALLRAAEGRPLQDIALAVQHGFLKSGTTYKRLGWPARPMLSPLARPLLRLYKSAAYLEAAERARRASRVTFDWEGFDDVRADLIALLEREEAAAPAGERRPLHDLGDEP
jgi:hypothetical protein